jgi:lipid-A-disaccharide synthase-like uncharacterized protein
VLSNLFPTFTAFYNLWLELKHRPPAAIVTAAEAK